LDNSIRRRPAGKVFQFYGTSVRILGRRASRGALVGSPETSVATRDVLGPPQVVRHLLGAARGRGRVRSLDEWKRATKGHPRDLLERSAPPIPKHHGMFDEIERILRALKRPDLAMLRRRAADLSRGAVEWVRTVVVGTVVTVVGGAVVRVVSAVRLDRIVAAKGVIALAAAALAGGWLVRSLFVVIGLADLGVAWALHVAEKSVARVERWARQDVSVGARGDDVPRIPSAAIPGLESLTGSLADLRARTIRMLRARDQLVRDAGRETDRPAASTQALSAAGDEPAATAHEIPDDDGVNYDG